MISKQQAKFIKSLQYKKYRKKAATFLVEGSKNVLELINSDFEVLKMYASEAFLEENPLIRSGGLAYEICSPDELSKAGTYQTNNSCIALVKIKEENSPGALKEKLVIVLDDVRDPGNLGAIIRIADWYGIAHILASETTADFYNPKVISASMGSFTRVSISYKPLEEILPEMNGRTIYGTFVQGENIHTASLETPAAIVMGNESNGISDSLINHIHKRISIPRFGNAESLNVAMSTAIICDNFMRAASKK